MNNREDKRITRAITRLCLVLAVAFLAAPQLRGLPQTTCLKRIGNGELCEYCVTTVEDGDCWTLSCCPTGGGECRGDHGGTSEQCPDPE